MIRGITIRGAVAINVITMIGIGPLITIPLVLAQLAGPLALAGWIAGALVALCDGLVWAQLGSRYPVSGGTYVYLREIFGRDRWGRMFAFLYNWQFFLSASLTISTGYIGFANYAGYLFPNVAASAALTHIVAVGVGLVTIFALYRRVTTAASFGAFLAVIAVGTLLLVAFAGYSHADFHRAFTLSAPLRFGWGFVAGLGGALYITLYDYAGYSQAALVGEEIAEPRRTLPIAILASILIVCALYVFLQIGVLSAIPWQSLVGKNGAPAPPEAQFVASTVVARSWGFVPAAIVTVLILITAFASVYGGLLGNSRVPFAAARDGAFLPVFARLHPTEHFPHVSLLLMGALSLVACFFDLGFVIAVIGTAGILIGSIGQIAALFVLRARGGETPFRMPLFPLPALVALAGWVLAFANTGATAMILGVAWLVLGVIVYLLTARAQRAWPFAAMLGVLLCAGIAPARAQTPFVYGATFFYERVPRDEWAPALARYKAMGVNTIDLYVMWNWHEVRDGDFDFTGRTNPRRDLKGLLHLIDADGFKIVLRPGPVIRNEWRNGGYPAWLLERPEYRMPFRDVLEGRYPATATLQNAHSDAAAAEWLANATHMRHAARWLRYALKAALPYKRDIVAIALDDDQGAYIDNDTWPAPHFHRYIDTLRRIVQRTAGADVPLFINTYEMKVTASAPVWAWGNWYQSDAYSIGEHDRAQLEFSTGLLQTQHRPVMISEFQAGWLQGADEAYPRPADPTNTTLALHTLLQMGAHGVINFPVQDTLDPAGWEAPWTNAFYSWDAALSVQLGSQARYAPTARFGGLIARYGDALARTHPGADAAIAYLTSAYDPARITNDDVYRVASATIEAQRGCRIMRITCALVDLRFSTAAQLGRFRTLIIPKTGVSAPYIPAVSKTLRAFSSRGGLVVASARNARIPHPAAGGIPNAVLLVDDAQRYAFLDIVNYGRTPLRTKAANVRYGHFAARVPALNIAPRDALLLPLGLPAATAASAPAPGAAPLEAHASIPLRPGSYVPVNLRAFTGSDAVAYRADVYRDGYSAVAFENNAIRLIVSPCAGARAFVFEDKRTGRNLFTTTGGLRDAWLQTLPPSPRDYIAPYTHPMATGTFNRCYDSTITRRSGIAAATFAYDAPDAPPHGAHFERTITLAPAAAEFNERIRAQMSGTGQRAQQITAFAMPSGTTVLSATSAYGFYDPTTHTVTLVSWDGAAVQAHALHRGAQSALLTLTFAPHHGAAVRYGVADAKTPALAQAALRAFANRPPSTP